MDKPKCQTSDRIGARCETCGESPLIVHIVWTGKIAVYFCAMCCPGKHGGHKP